MPASDGELFLGSSHVSKYYLVTLHNKLSYVYKMLTNCIRIFNGLPISCLGHKRKQLMIVLT